MKTQIAYLVAAMSYMVLVGCQSRQELNSHIGLPVQVKPEMPIKDVYHVAAAPKQKFTINLTKANKIIGKEGTVIYLKPYCLTDEQGNTAQGEAEIELIEIYTKSSMFFNNKPTVADGKLLVSGGQIFLQAYQSKKPLLIGCAEGIAIQMAKKIQKPYEFDVFRGEPQPDGTVNWKLNQQEKQLTFYQINEQNSEEESQLYYEDDDEINPYFRFATRQFGWINCDKFYDLDVEKQDLVVQLKNKPRGKDYKFKVVLFFDRWLAVMNAYPNEKGHFVVHNIPVEEPITILAVVANKKSIYFARQKIQHAGGQADIEVVLAASTPEAVKKQIEKLN